MSSREQVADVAHGLQQIPVVRSGGEREMELDVGVRVQGRARRGLVHTLDGAMQGGDLLVRGALRR